ncbi:hypothetical protein B0I33_107164 [Prauserella shujinwangii]|uniref:ClpX-type ZB domain-containing protein n=1 Tax=Prauserella shujinwangii TaxID=1453103 RepID=A0A2T0LSE1_9PSEU|nr:hypothetical protein [Prauserella shujinwangii]PRX46587.1 hypothetical protein B0I33_107164 [Prauserella shujinwangii]
MPTGSDNPRRQLGCRFCARVPVAGEPRFPGPRGPICVPCLETGLRLVATRRPGPDRERTGVVRTRSADDLACECCGRYERRDFLGFRRPLTRMHSPEAGAAICADCLDRAGDLINRALAGTG